MNVIGVVVGVLYGKQILIVAIPHEMSMAHHEVQQRHAIIHPMRHCHVKNDMPERVFSTCLLKACVPLLCTLNLTLLLRLPAVEHMCFKLVSISQRTTCVIHTLEYMESPAKIIGLGPKHVRMFPHGLIEAVQHRSKLIELTCQLCCMAGDLCLTGCVISAVGI